MRSEAAEAERSGDRSEIKRSVARSFASDLERTLASASSCDYGILILESRGRNSDFLNRARRVLNAVPLLIPRRLGTDLSHRESEITMARRIIPDMRGMLLANPKSENHAAPPPATFARRARVRRFHQRSFGCRSTQRTKTRTAQNVRPPVTNGAVSVTPKPNPCDRRKSCVKGATMQPAKRGRTSFLLKFLVFRLPADIHCF